MLLTYFDFIELDYYECTECFWFWAPTNKYYLLKGLRIIRAPLYKLETEDIEYFEEDNSVEGWEEKNARLTAEVFDNKPPCVGEDGLSVVGKKYPQFKRLEVYDSWMHPLIASSLLRM